MPGLRQTHLQALKIIQLIGTESLLVHDLALAVIDDIGYSLDIVLELIIAVNEIFKTYHRIVARSNVDLSYAGRAKKRKQHRDKQFIKYF